MQCVLLSQSVDIRRIDKMGVVKCRILLLLAYFNPSLLLIHAVVVVVG